MAKHAGSMTDTLRRRIAASGMTYLELERATGIERASIMRFMLGKQSLRLDKADVLAAYFGLELRGIRKGR